MNVVLRACGLVVVLVVCLVPVAGAQVDAGRTLPRFVAPTKVVKTPRVQSQLAAVAAAAQQRGAAAGLQAARDRGLETSQGKVRVIVEAASSIARQAVAAQGGSVEAVAGGLTEALVPAGAVTALARTSRVDFVRAPFAFELLGTTESQGVAATAAAAWHTAGATGAGAKVAIIDAGFAGVAARQASGDLPAGLTNLDYCGGSMGAPENHGTAVAEIVHEMAPSAALTLICFDSEVDLATALAYVKANGITIVNHSVGWYNTSRGDGTGAAGTPDAIVADARASGILWVNAAGNGAQAHWGGTYAGSDLHQFVPGDVSNSLVLFPNDEVCGFLKWDAWPATDQDFDLYLGRDATGLLVAGSVNDQTGSQRPTEEFCYRNTTGNTEVVSFLIDRHVGTTSPRLDLFVTIINALEHQTVAGSLSEPGTAPGALAVGAICWQNDSVEPYSSRGPTIDGRTKPDIAGQSAVTSAVYGAFSTCGTSGFTGTSSASPHVAGAAALLKAMFPLATVSELQSWLETDALDLGAAGKDTSTGAGKLRLPTAAPAASTTAPAVAAAQTTASIDVSGSVTPNGLATSYYWEYGPTTGYGSQTTPVALTSPRTGQQVGSTLTSLTPDTDYHYRLVATNLFGSTAGADQLQRTAPPLAPQAVSDVPEEVGAEAARLSGSVTPLGSVTTARFEWGETTAYGNLTPQQGVGVVGTSDLAAELTGLTPNTEYHYRVVASNAHGTTNGADQTFTTTVGGTPIGVTGAATGLSTTTATLNADINPNGLATTYHFEYGLASASTLQQTATVQSGYGPTVRAVSTGVTGLQAATQYRFRVVVTNSLGTTNGDFATFTTAALPPPPGGGGGGGGGVGGSADLLIEGSAQPLQAPVGSELTFQLRATDVNQVLAFGVKVDVAPSAGLQLVGSSADRGPGCAGAPTVCDLDMLGSFAPVGTITLRTRVTAAGEQSLSGTVRYSGTDPKPENNSVTIVVNRGTTPVPLSTPVPQRTTAGLTNTGNARANTLRGTARADTLRGLGGNDRLYGLAGNDRLFGGTGADHLFGGAGRDLLEGGTGNDVISARDRTRDTIRCGPGRDIVTADRGDTVARDCERVTRR